MTMNCNFGLRGIIKKIKLIDTRTGETVDERNNIPNMLLGDFLDSQFTNKYANPITAEEDARFRPTHCFIGSDDTPPERNHSTVLSQLAKTGNVISRNFSSFGDRVQFDETVFKFAAGSGTGTIRELGLSTEDWDWDNANIARQIIDPEIIKEDYHELQVTWRRELFAPDSWSGTISNGGREGEDINWVMYINNEQLSRIGGAVRIGSAAWNPLNNFYGIGHESHRPGIIVGTSNEPSDLENDGRYTIKGTELYSGEVNFHSYDSYESGTYNRSFRVGLEQEIGTGDIGEVLLCTEKAKDTDYNYTGFCRITFEPKLSKLENFRLYFDCNFGYIEQEGD